MKSEERCISIIRLATSDFPRRCDGKRESGKDYCIGCLNSKAYREAIRRVNAATNSEETK